jgi:hypothetical protein
MASQNRKRSFTFEAGADLSSDQFKFVKISAGQVVLQDTAGASCVGVLQTTASAQGRAVEVACGPGQIVKVIAGGTVAQDAKVQSDEDGEALTAASGDHVQGIALTGGDAGELIEVLLMSEHILA